MTKKWITPSSRRKELVRVLLKGREVGVCDLSNPKGRAEYSRLSGMSGLQFERIAVESVSAPKSRKRTSGQLSLF